MAKQVNRTERAPIVNAEITQEIIDRSVKGNSRMCMIAEAIKQARPDVVNVAVDTQSCRFTDPKKGRRYTYYTPRNAQLRLLQFDVGQLPEPFVIRLQGAHIVTSKIGKPKQGPNPDKAPRQGRPKMVNAHGGVQRVGGQVPPQLKVIRQFGLRAFQGFNDELKKQTATT